MERQSPTIEVVGLRKSYAIHSIFGSRSRAVALDGVSLKVPAGGSVGIVGESGSGKSTLVRCILGLERQDEGDIVFEGKALEPGYGARNRKGQIQPVFQNPTSSLNPRRKIGNIIAEPLAVHTGKSKAERREAVRKLLDRVGLPRSFAERYPRQLSGGQCQRVSIARALALEPTLIIADEATSALDVLVQQQIIVLLQELRRELRMAMLFVSHNLAVTRMICDDIVVMYRGQVVEGGPAGQVITQPQHPYTQNLIRSVPALTVPEETATAGGSPA
jgi:ABC-type glutathione transport system ATPase component